MPMNEAHLNTIIWCTGLYNEGFYGMGPFIGEASPTRKKQNESLFFFAMMIVNMLKLRPSCYLFWKVY